MLRAYTSIVVCLSLASASRAEPPKVNYLFPAGAARGQEATITASGSFSNWPPSIWIDRPGVTIEAAEKKGELTVRAGDDAGFGLYWLRLYDNEGASELRPFIVDGAAEFVEEERNDAPRQAQAVKAPVVVNGKLDKREDVDGFAVDLKQGQTLVASLAAHHTLGSPMDAVLQICDSNGFVLAQNDDARGFDPLLVFAAPADGAYIARTFAFPATPDSSIRFASGDNFVYRLTLTIGGFVDHCLPLALPSSEPGQVQLFGWGLDGSAAVASLSGGGGAPQYVYQSGAAGFFAVPATEFPSLVAADDCSADAPQTVEIPAVISGRIEAPKDVDAFEFSATKESKLSLKVESRALGFPLDPVLSVVDEAGKSLAEEDDASRDERDAALVFTPPADGKYRVQVRDLHGFGGLRYAYRLTIAEQTPDYELELSSGQFTLTAGKPLEIEVKINRNDGFDGAIEISAADLPEGVAVEAVKSEAGERSGERSRRRRGGSGETVKLKLTADSGPASGPFRIVGRVADKPQLDRTAQFTVAGENATHSAAWLTVVGMNEEK